MTSTKSLFFALLLALTVPACTAGVGADTMEEAETDDLGGKEDGVARPEGSYFSEAAARPGNISELFLDVESKTYQMTWSSFGNGRSLHDEQGTGAYRFTKSGRNRYIRFLDADGQLLNRYQYKFSGATLQLKADWSDTWFGMEQGLNDERSVWTRQVKAHFLENYDAFVDGVENPDIHTVRRASLPQSVQQQYDYYKRGCDTDAECNMAAYTDSVEGLRVYYVLELRPNLGVATIYDESGERLASGIYGGTGEWNWD